MSVPTTADLAELFDSFVVDQPSDIADHDTVTPLVAVSWTVVWDDIPTLQRTGLLPSRLAAVAQDHLAQLNNHDYAVDTLIKIANQTITAKNLVNVWDSLISYYSSDHSRTNGTKIIEAADASVEEYLIYLASLGLFDCHVLADADWDVASDCQSDSAEATELAEESQSADSVIYSSSAESAAMADLTLDSMPTTTSELTAKLAVEISQQPSSGPSDPNLLKDFSDTEWLLPHGQFILISFLATNSLISSANHQVNLAQPSLELKLALFTCET